MLLRSASTPILGSLLASCSSPYFSESPGHGGGNNNPLERSYADSLKKIAFHRHGGVAGHGHHHLHAFPCQLATPRDAPEVAPGTGGFRRVRSDGNLRDLVAADRDDLTRRSGHHVPPTVKPASRRPSPFLESIPSFSWYDSKQREVTVEEEDREKGTDNDGIEISVTEAEIIGSDDFLPVGNERGTAAAAGGGTGAAPLFLAMGLGLNDGNGASGLLVGFGGGADGGGGGGGHPVAVGNGGDRSDLETYYQKTVEEDPQNALFLRNYAQFLYQTKRDLGRAEYYYSRALLAEPGDGEVLSQYARLIWELHGDRERASSYFEQAAQAAPEDSHVLAAYAGFLWETEDDENGGGGGAGRPRDFAGARVPYGGALASAARG